MSNLGPGIFPMQVEEGIDNHYEKKSDDFITMTDVNGKGEFSDPCELLWQQAGEYVQELFEKPQSSSKSHSGSESSTLSPQSISNPVNREYKESMHTTKYIIQSPSLAEWVRDNVEILYDE